MKKPQTTTEKPLDTTKTEKTAATKNPKTAPKKTSSAQSAEKKAKTVPPKAKEEQVKSAATPEAAPKKSSAKPTAEKKAETIAPELTMSQRVGLTAGDIWNYLTENGATSVSKLVAALTEEEKIIQRSIGWLAQEDKITISTVDRVETITLNT